jgi:alpha-D-ribose 1-methylphosphonate 5-triphosphate synthase subunit PhnL
VLVTWKQRNARAFNNVALQCSAMQLVSRIKEEFRLWNLARPNTRAGGSSLRVGE